MNENGFRRSPLKPEYSTVFNLNDVLIDRHVTALMYVSPHKTPLLHELTPQEKTEAMWVKNVPFLDRFDWAKNELKVDDIPRA